MSLRCPHVGRVAPRAGAYSPPPFGWNPLVDHTRMAQASETVEESEEEGRTDAEIEVRRRHLEAMGSVT